MGKTGWWTQIQSGNYPESQTDYGQDLQALEGERRNPSEKIQNYEVQQLQEKCPLCNKLYWIDKGCPTCTSGLTDKNKIPLQRIITIKCKVCKHSKTYTEDDLKLLSSQLSVAYSCINKKIIGQNLKRFICTKCNSKNCRLL